MWTITKNKDWDFLCENFDWVKRMERVPQDPRHHAEGNVAIHTRMVLEALEAFPAYQKLEALDQEILWAAALLHDNEKYSTTVTEADGSITAHGHARKGAMKSRQILYREVSTPFWTREQIVALVRYHGLPLWLLEKPDPLKTLIKASYEVNMEWLTLLAKADALGRICQDKDDLLYRIDCFEEFCRDNNCWGTRRDFKSAHARMYYLQKENSSADYVPYQEPEAEVILLAGLPGAGKDTYIKTQFTDIPVISLDDIRREKRISPTDKKANGKVIQEAKEKAKVMLRKKKGFVWNATNITAQMRSQLIELFTSYGASVRIVYIEAPYLVLKQQNTKREAMVPGNVMERLIDKLEVPAAWEAHKVEYSIS
ncbi:AAA family ATPase [Desertivirga xinjiangensis]|uniref:AAA family ATPase n=1 Tax=Desertivirga xinjiangensis TaxID=539206 RepID=UPI00210923A0|nr:AAA family ATPase [Pedobacter xinjiangensis]